MDVGLLAYANMLIGAGGLARYMHGHHMWGDMWGEIDADQQNAQEGLYFRAALLYLPSREEDRDNKRKAKMFELYYAIALIAAMAYLVNTLNKRCHHKREINPYWH